MSLKDMLALVITFIQECPQALRLTLSKWTEFMLTEHGLHQRLAACSLPNKNGPLNGLTLSCSWEVTLTNVKQLNIPHATTQRKEENEVYIYHCKSLPFSLHMKDYK